VNPRLKIMKSEGSKNPTEARFLVMDLDLALNYPENFICVLPRNLSSPNMADCVFMRIFGKPDKIASKKTAGQLLERASTAYPEYKPEIERRLETLRLL